MGTELPGSVFSDYPFPLGRCQTLSLDGLRLELAGRADIEHALRAEVLLELANEHMGFEGMAVRLNGASWCPIPFPQTSPRTPSPSLWFHHWYPTIPVEVPAIAASGCNVLELRAPAECFDGEVHPNGKVTKEHPNGEWGALAPWMPVYGATLRVHYDPARKPHPVGKILTPAAGSAVGVAAELTACVSNEAAPIHQIDFIGRYQDINYEGDGIYDQWHGHLFNSKITHHLGSTHQPGNSVIWDTSWVPDQPGPMAIAARIVDSSGLTSITAAVEGLTLIRPGLSVELCKPMDVPRSFTGCQYGEWVVPGVRTQRFMVKGDVSQILDARYAIASWGDLKLCHGYKISDVLLEDKPSGADWFYNLSTPPIRPLAALKTGENTFSTVVGPGRVPDIYMPGVQVLIRYREE